MNDATAALPQAPPPAPPSIPADAPARLLAALRGWRPALEDLLARLARAESPSDRPETARAALDLLAVEFREIGWHVRRRAARSSAGLLYARPQPRPRGRPVQLLVGHADTVWPVGTLGRMPVTRDGDTLRGPGVFDMKGGLVQMVFALRALGELGLEPPAVPVAVVTTDEETGSRDAKPLLVRLARRAARAFVMEPAFGRDGRLKTARKGVGSFTVAIKGRAAHAGIDPGQGASAVLELAHQVQRLFALNDPARGVTVNVGTVGGGLRANVVAAEVTAEVDVRVPTLADAERVAAALAALTPVDPRCTVTVTGGFDHPPMEAAPRHQALWQLARDLGGRLGITLEQAAVGGASDGNTLSQYTPTLDGLGAVGDGAHAEHEFVELPRMAERAALLALLLLAPVAGNAPPLAEGPP